MRYRATDYILPILAPLMVYLVIWAGFVWQHEKQTDEKVRYRLIEMVNLLTVNIANHQLISYSENIPSKHSIIEKYKTLQNEQKVLPQLVLKVLSLSQSGEQHNLNPQLTKDISQQILSLSSLLKPVFIKADKHWHYISPLSDEQALLLTLERSDSEFAWYQDNTLILRVLLSTFIVTLLMLFAFKKYIRLSVDQAKEVQQALLAEQTREITLIHNLISNINQLDNLKQASLEIKRSLPEIFPEFSGAILFNEQSNKRLSPYASWGRNSTYTESLIITEQWYKSSRRKQKLDQYYYLKNRSLIIALTDQNNQYGALHLMNDYARINSEKFEQIVKFTAQLNIALINLQLKNDFKEKVIRDPLTNLYNRRFLSESLEKSLSGAIRYKSTLAILMVDLDHFKKINDTYGHCLGDKVLKTVADLFKQNLRLSDIACRYGGEEFCIICPDTNLREAYILGEKLRCLVEKLIVDYQNQQIIKVTTSIGIAMYPRNGTNAEKLLFLADQALYQAKERGRNRVIVSEVEELTNEQINQ